MKDVNMIKRFVTSDIQSYINFSKISVYMKSLSLILLFSCGAENLPAPVKLRCMGRENPGILLTGNPHLSWQIPQNTEISAIQIQVAKLPEILLRHRGNYWDTGKLSYQDTVIKYLGDTLQSEQKYYWRIRYWDENDQVSDYSEISYWETGLLDHEDWKSKWIQVDSIHQTDQQMLGFREQLESLKEVRRARLYLESREGITPVLYRDKNQVMRYDSTYTDSSICYSYVITPHIFWGNNCFGLRGMKEESVFRAQFSIAYYDGDTVLSRIMSSDALRLDSQEVEKEIVHESPCMW